MATLTPVIRDADAARDAAACAEIYAHYVLHSPATFDEEPPDAAAVARKIEAHGASHAWLVYEREGALRGFAYGSPHRERSAYRLTAEVTVYVAPGHQGAGIGRALYVNLIDRLRIRGLRVALAGITLPNPASEALHAAFGFEPVGVFRHVGLKGGTWHDVGWWQLDLGAAEGHLTPG